MQYAIPEYKLTKYQIPMDVYAGIVPKADWPDELGDDRASHSSERNYLYGRKEQILSNIYSPLLTVRNAMQLL